MYKKQIQHAQKTNTKCTKNKYKNKNNFYWFYFIQKLLCLRVACCVSSACKYEVFMRHDFAQQGFIAGCMHVDDGHQMHRRG